MIIHVFDEQQSLKISLDSIIPLVEQIIAEEQQTCDEVSIYFVDTQRISELHQDFFDDPSPTDCISFPMDEDDNECYYRILGEVFVCPQTAIDYVQDKKADPYEETTLYIVHGLLHLMGYRDIDEEDIKQMRLAENRQMTKLKRMDLCLKPLI